MGPRRFERPTSSLSGTRSNQLSYEPGLATKSVAFSRVENCKAGGKSVNNANATKNARLSRR